MDDNWLFAIIALAFVGLMGGFLYVQHSENMACIQAGIKISDCAVTK